MVSLPRVLAVLPGFVPSTEICVVRPFVSLHRAGRILARVTLERFVSPRDLAWANLVVFCRNTEPKFSWILDHLLERDLPFIYDVDDNLFSVPVDSEVGRYHALPACRAMLARYLEGARAVRVYSSEMADAAEVFNRRVAKVRAPIDSRLIEPPSSARHPRPVRIVYATSRTEDRLAAVFMPAVVAVLEDFGECAEVHFWGARPPAFPSTVRIHHHPAIRSYHRFLGEFSRMGFDIGLAPLLDDPFHRAKTNNKFREYGGCGIAGIYSDVCVYSSCVEDGVTGLLVSNDPLSWYEALNRLIRDGALRRTVGARAREYVLAHYSRVDFEDEWLRQIVAVVEERGGGGLRTDRRFSMAARSDCSMHAGTSSGLAENGQAGESLEREQPVSPSCGRQWLMLAMGHFIQRWHDVSDICRMRLCCNEAYDGKVYRYLYNSLKWYIRHSC